MKPVLVVGSGNVDLTVILDRLPVEGDTVFGTASSIMPGGKGLNQAIAIHRAGADCSFTLCTGVDAEADFLEEFLRSNLEKITQIKIPELATGKAHIYVSSRGENQIVVMPGSNLAVELANAEVFGEPGFLVLQLEIGFHSNLALAQRAKLSGWKVVLTPAPVAQFSADFLPLVDILVLNKNEALQISSKDSVEEAGAHLAEFIETVIITLGSEGSMIFESGRPEVHVPARMVTPVDTTGAGDTFCGYLVAMLSQGHVTIEAVKIATVAASISVQSPGAAPSIPSLVDVKKML